MTRVIPAILARDEQDFRKKVATMGPVAPLLHIDVLDGSLYTERSFAPVDRIASMRLAFPFEVHLMVQHPESVVKQWLDAGAQRIILHAESEGSLVGSLENIRARACEAGITLAPETDLAALNPFLTVAQYVQVMGVHPGAMGRPFSGNALERLRTLHRNHPTLRLGADGGIKKDTITKVVKGGAQDLVVGSGIWGGSNPIESYQMLVKMASGS